MNIAGHLGIVGRDALVVAFNFLRRDNELLIGLESSRLVVPEHAGANFWPRKIDQHGKRPIHLFSGCARQRDIVCLFVARAMRHVNAHAVYARRQHRLQYFRISRCGADGRQNLRSCHELSDERQKRNGTTAATRRA